MPIRWVGSPLDIGRESERRRDRHGGSRRLFGYVCVHPIMAGFSVHLSCQYDNPCEDVRFITASPAFFSLYLLLNEMPNPVTFTVNDTSPTILYSPFADTLSTPNLTAGWNPYYTLSGYSTVLGQVGIGTSRHITSDNGSSLLVQWNGMHMWTLGEA